MQIVKMMQNGKRIPALITVVIIFCLVSIMCCPTIYSPSAIAKNSNAQDSKIRNKAALKPESGGLISEREELDWRKKSTEAGMLVFYNKYTEADQMLVNILPLARKENPNGIDLGICIFRYGYCLVGEEKYQQSLSYLDEALKIVQKTPATKRQKKAIFQILRTTSIAYMRLHQFDKGENIARKAIAYRIAFPETSTFDYFRNTYKALQLCLENQKKSDEANVIAEVIKTLS